jgi:hypothetical protein
MNHKDLFNGADRYHTDYGKYNISYRATRRKEDTWKNFDSEGAAKIIVNFLNGWGCMLTSHEELLKAICTTYKETAPYLNALKDERLEDINFEKVVMVDNKQSMKCSAVIFYIYSKFSNIGFKFRHTAASKTLHMISPNLFVMWDGDIWERYFERCKYEIAHERNDYNYTFVFMPGMQKEINEAIGTYMNDNKCERSATIRNIESRYDMSLPKVLDECNWINKEG